ncbi:MAG: hypothetical protein ACFFG0_03000 [Candidatus Thorarchaeota archaeon]
MEDIIYIVIAKIFLIVFGMLFGIIGVLGAKETCNYDKIACVLYVVMFIWSLFMVFVGGVVI